MTTFSETYLSLFGHPLTAAEHLEYWTAMRNHFAAKCSAARISGNYPAQFRAWEAEIRRCDVRLHMLADYAAR